MHPHEANRALWNRSAGWWKEKEDERGLWRKAVDDPAAVLDPAERPWLEAVAGREVCVLGSGDNEVAFALAGLGARVTSVDISERRLEIAAERARTLGIAPTFVRADVTDLAPLADGAFDLVYTGGHMSIWISDIGRYYAEAVRVLRPGGTFVVNDYHPIRRVWQDGEGPGPHHDYFDRGPYRYEEDGLPSFEYHWTTADHVQAVLDAGCRIVKLDEIEKTIDDEFWLKADLEKLPAFLLIVGRKEPAG